MFKLDLSVSSFNKFVRCQRLYGIEKAMGWYELTKKPWLEFGSKFDDLMAIIDVEGVKDLDKHLITFSDPIIRANAEYLALKWYKLYKDDLQPPVECCGQLGNQFKIDLNLSHLVDHKFELNMIGYVDKVYLHDGEPAINERKTTSDPINEGSAYWNRLDFDPQIVGYSYGLSNMLGAPVSQGTYEVFRKPSDKTLSKMPTDPKAYREKLLTGLYEPYNEDEITIKRDATMVARRPYFITDELREAFEREFAQVAYQIYENTQNMEEVDEPEQAWMRNSGSCELFMGCPYKEFCACKSGLEDIKFITKKEN